MDETDDQDTDKSVESLSWGEFLESKPPNQECIVTDFAVNDPKSSHPTLIVPNLTLFCASTKCGGDRTFRCTTAAPSLTRGQTRTIFLAYHCRNCQSYLKQFAIEISLLKQSLKGKVIKFGERPNFGPHTPSRVISMIGPDREIFLKGRSAENQGLGIGAFAYYRRVVENQKDRIIDTIINVAEKLEAQQAMVDDLRRAKAEVQFSSAVESIKHGIPDVLKINGHSPLLLLHKALSQGLHADSDEECLELAQSIRVVLAELAERVGIAVKDQAELNAAVTRLFKATQQKQKETGQREPANHALNADSKPQSGFEPVR